ncbi:MAG: MFS transporter [Verrucomicrobia bacterium]|nr:MFS transporter [Verrucomicrobiota bacterium]MCH8511512.1 MFS transporter [Kiritimatiellia bacterium]
MSTTKRENLWINLALNVILPSVLLTKGDEWLGLPSAFVLIIAIAFPVSYGIYDYVTRDKVNLFSVIGFVSVLITGVIGLLHIPSRWIAVKEAAVPLLFGLVILATAKSKKPFIHRVLYSPEMFDVTLIEASLDEKGTRKQFDQVMLVCTYWLVASFLVSAVLNFILASIIVTAESSVDPELFNQQIGRMTALSWPVIVLPSMVIMMVALFKLIKGIEACTGHVLEDVLHPDMREKMEQKDAARKKDQPREAVDTEEKEDPAVG